MTNPNPEKSWKKFLPKVMWSQLVSGQTWIFERYCPINFRLEFSFSHRVFLCLSLVSRRFIMISTWSQTQWWQWLHPDQWIVVGAVPAAAPACSWPWRRSRAYGMEWSEPFCMHANGIGVTTKWFVCVDEYKGVCHPQCGTFENRRISIPRFLPPKEQCQEKRWTELVACGEGDHHLVSLSQSHFAIPVITRGLRVAVEDLYKAPPSSVRWGKSPQNGLPHLEHLLHNVSVPHLCDIICCFYSSANIISISAVLSSN